MSQIGVSRKNGDLQQGVLLCKKTYSECFYSLVKVSDVLWNLYSYYKQFIPYIEQCLHEMRKPIEKELKVCNFKVV